MIRVTVESVGLVAPGMPGWDAARGVLCGKQSADLQESLSFRPNLLPPNERRRTTALIKLALQTAEDALTHSRYRMDELASVFASADGDGDIVDRLCTALTAADRPVSPTNFHNSVHNAPAGYWAIASGSQRFSTSIAGGPDTFAAGLLEAASVAVQEQLPVLLLAYDYSLPPALAGRGYVDLPFAVALLLTAEDIGDCPQLLLDLTAATVTPPPLPGELEPLRAHNPAAAALPLLQALARNESRQIEMPCHAGLGLVLKVVA